MKKKKPTKLRKRPHTMFVLEPGRTAILAAKAVAEAQVALKKAVDLGAWIILAPGYAPAVIAPRTYAENFEVWLSILGVKVPRDGSKRWESLYDRFKAYNDAIGRLSMIENAVRGRQRVHRGGARRARRSTGAAVMAIAAKMPDEVARTFDDMIEEFEHSQTE